MSRFTIVLTDADEHPLQSEQKRHAAAAGAELVGTQCATEAEVISACRSADAILNSNAPITAGVVETLERCKVVSRYGVGVDNIDVDAATRCGIIVANVPDFCVEEVSDHAMLLLLSTTKKLPVQMRLIREGGWGVEELRPITRFTKRTVGLVGLGRIGGRIAEKVAAFGPEVIAYDPYIESDVVDPAVKIVEFDDLLRNADMIVISCPATSETFHLFDRSAFKSMKSEAILINVARGSIVDEPALIDALRAGTISGAGLDVFEYEPVGQDNPLLQMENVVVTPHVASYSEESRAEMYERALENVLRVLRGEAPLSAVNPQLLEQRS